MLLDHFSQAQVGGRPLKDYLLGETPVRDLATMKEVLDYIHISQGLLRFYGPDYPVIESRELLPSFEDNLQEYRQLPGFSLLVLDREIDYLAERFQFDLLDSAISPDTRSQAEGRPPAPDPNKEIFKSRLPRELHLDFKLRMAGKDITQLHEYPAVADFLFNMDRGHVMARDPEDCFRLLGVFASFPSNLDVAIKALGRRIGKFKPRDNALYEKNRLMVYRFLMELYGFPIASERRTSAALFARELARRQERFMIKVQGQSDRVITTLYHPKGEAHYPQVDKVALVPLSIKGEETIKRLESEGYFVDADRQVVLLRAIYQQHPYNKHNINEERALSLEHQEIIHPRTGERLPWLSVLQTKEDRLIRLNDIIRGEYSGRIIFQHQEVIEGTADHEQRLKFLSAWLLKHQRRLITTSRSYMEKVESIIDAYILNPELADEFIENRELHKRILGQMAYIKQANEVHRLELMFRPRTKTKHLEKLRRLVEFFEANENLLDGYYEPIFEKLLFLCDQLLTDKYILGKYIQAEPKTGYGRQVRESFNRLAQLKQEAVNSFSAQKEARSRH